MIDPSPPNPSTTRLKILAGHAPSGQAVIEELPCEALDGGSYRLLASPAFAKGIAKGDRGTVNERGEFTLLQRSGNLCVRVIAREGLEELEQGLTSQLEKLGGSCDIKSDRILVYSIHVSCGFQHIEKLLNDALQGASQATWLYGNVYDPADGSTPLNWWQDILKPE